MVVSVGARPDSELTVLPAPLTLKGVLSEDPRLLSALLNVVGRKVPIDQLLKGFAFEPRILQSDSAGASSGVLGIHNHYLRELMPYALEGHINPTVIGFRLETEGTTAFNHRVNPEDFTKTTLSLGGYRFLSGLNRLKTTPVEADAFQALVLRVAGVDGTPEDLDRSPEWRDFMAAFRRIVLSKMGLQMYWDLHGQASLESDQAFIRKQWTYGIESSLLLRNESPGSILRVFDMPFAALRMLSGADDRIAPQGSGFPRLIAGVDMVTPAQNTPREDLLGNKDPYGRLRAEAQMEGGVAGGKDFDGMRLKLRWRYFRELDPDQVIRDADLATSSYFEALIDLPKGWQVTYTDGRLPFDVRTTQGLQLGWTYTLKSGDGRN
jgi:hypothetical protein